MIQRAGMMVLVAGVLVLWAAVLWPGMTTAQDATPTTVVKRVCLSALGYAELEPLKQELLAQAKREASNELFGELIASTTTVENLAVTADRIRLESLGLLRLDGSASYANGVNLAEVCVTITAYVTEQDRAQFALTTVTGRRCVTNPALPVRQLRTQAEEGAQAQALADYDARLEGYALPAVLTLLRRVAYSESNLLPGTDTYCATVTGALIPVEVLSFLGLEGELEGGAAAVATPRVAPTAVKTPTPPATPTPRRTPSAAEATSTAAQATIAAFQSRTPTPTPTATATPNGTATAVVATAQAIATLDAQEAAVLAATAQAMATAEAWTVASAGLRAAVMATAVAAGQTVEDVLVNPADGAVYVYVPAGEFLMGSPDGVGDADEQPQRTVYLDEYWIGQTEVTNGHYQTCVDAGACEPPQKASSQTRGSYFGNPEYADYPVINVDWRQADAFCAWAGGRLPTEAEWEKAARRTDGRTYPWGNEAPTQELANFGRNAGDTTPVGSYLAGVSPYGALDMAGNVWEWVNDWYGKDYYRQSPRDNPPGPATGSSRVLRGGSWTDIDIGVRSAYRFNFVPDYGYVNLGFRCVRSP